MNLLLFRILELGFLLFLVCSAVPLEKNATNRGEVPCIVLGICSEMNDPSRNPPPSVFFPPPPHQQSSPPSSTSSSLAISTIPTTPPIPVSTPIDPYLYGCSRIQRDRVKEAWGDAGRLADAHAKWRPPGWFGFEGTYQAAQSMYLADDSKHDVPWFGTGPLRRSSGPTPNLIQI